MCKTIEQRRPTKATAGNTDPKSYKATTIEGGWTMKQRKIMNTTGVGRIRTWVIPPNPKRNQLKETNK